MPNPTTRRLLRRLAIAFVGAFVPLTAVLIANFTRSRLPELRSSGAPTSTIDVALLSLPFTAAMTIPMAVLIAALWVFTRLGADGALAAARRERHGVRRLVTPVLGAAAVVAAMTFVLNDQIVPRANERLARALARGVHHRSDRELTIRELRAEARGARADAAPNAARAASFEVEIQKKYALAAACVVLALTGVAIALLFPRGGVVLVIGAFLAVVTSYYAGLVVGERLADSLLVSPFVAMWMSNALLLAPALLVVWWRSRVPGPPRGGESLAIGR